MLPTRYRLRTAADFAAAVRSRRSGSPRIVVHAHRADARTDLPPRVGFVVSRAVGSAVVRNRTKRRLRALMAARLPSVPAGFDVVIRANAAAAEASFDVLGTDLDRLLGTALTQPNRPAVRR